MSVRRILVILVVAASGGLSSGVASGSAPAVTVTGYPGPGGDNGDGRVVFRFSGLPACPNSTSLLPVRLRAPTGVELLLSRGSRVVWRATPPDCVISGSDDWTDSPQPSSLFALGGGGNTVMLWPRLQHSGRHGFRWVVLRGGQPFRSGYFTVVVKVTPSYRIYQGRDAFQNYCKNKHQTIWSSAGRLFCNFPRRVWYSFALAGR